MKIIYFPVFNDRSRDEFVLYADVMETKTRRRR